MSAPHGCTDDTAVVESFKEALKQRIGADRFRMWFAHGVTFTVTESGPSSADRPAESSVPPAADGATRGCVTVAARGQFAVDRIRKHFMRELRGAAMQVAGSPLEVRLVIAGESLSSQPHRAADASIDASAGSTAEGSPADASYSAEQAPANPPSSAASASGGVGDSSRGASRRQRKGRQASSLSSLLAGGAATAGAAVSPGARSAERGESVPASPAQRPTGTPGEEQTNGRSGAAGEAKSAEKKNAMPAMTLANFVAGPSNQLAHTAVTMACQTPGAASPLFLFGPTGVGKTHLLAGIAEQLRRRHRLRRVIHLSAEQFTNDFIKSVGSSGLPAFRRRYRDVDALLVDDVQFLGAKKATLREMLYTVETLAACGRPLVFTANQSPAEIPGLTRELAGRLAAGLVCPVQPLDTATRETLLRRAIDQRCLLPWTDEMIAEVNSMLSGDGRAISGVVNLVGTLQRMYRRMPTMEEIRQYGGEMLRAQSPTVSLSAIERAVCETFGLDQHTLRAPLQTRSVTEPRMLAMYLSRQLTSSAFSEIARHYGGRSHSTAIAAAKKVQHWLEDGKSVGRGAGAMSARQALERIESILRAG